MPTTRRRPPRVISAWLNYCYQLRSIRTAWIGWTGTRTHQNAVGRREIRKCCVKNEIQNENVN